MGIWIGDMRFASVRSATEYFERQRRYRGFMGKVRKIFDSLGLRRTAVAPAKGKIKNIKIG